MNVQRLNWPDLTLQYASHYPSHGQRAAPIEPKCARKKSSMPRHRLIRRLNWNPFVVAVPLAYLAYSAYTSGFPLWRTAAASVVGLWFGMSVFDWVSKHRLLDWMYPDVATDAPGAGGFRDFITSRAYRKQIEDDYAELESIRPPEN